MADLWTQATGWQDAADLPFGFSAAHKEDNTVEITMFATPISGKDKLPARKDLSLVLTRKQVESLYTMLTTIRIRMTEEAQRTAKEANS